MTAKNRGPQIPACDTRQVNSVARLIEERGVRDTMRIVMLAVERATEAPAARKRLLEHLEQWMKEQ